ncbi:thiamine pyrophosphokinase [Gregarina niphandrodes]|uniref:Thiamine pyrophosphokinase n=1 Tax=Gregarina niphandrodes TaxID=110365 RepID=A0A023BA66_GRENI|nr:thiamine pyrophosphokinase [Gregarina niphandrodes]EZG77880.1 thiamine pyrophosphokinase [Gregarina niphandrodes]|eukprot:XP_011129480.1 thiamine pyrophosphokinase [Gregarina niphandrodes]
MDSTLANFLDLTFLDSLLVPVPDADQAGAEAGNIDTSTAKATTSKMNSTEDEPKDKWKDVGSDEPAAESFDLVILNSLVTPHLGRLVARCGAVFCADGGSNRLVESGVLPETSSALGRLSSYRKWVVGDLDSARPETLRVLRQEHGFAVLQLVDENSTDFHKALWLRDRLRTGDQPAKTDHGRDDQDHGRDDPGQGGGRPRWVIVEGGFGLRFDQCLASISEGLKFAVRHRDSALLFLGEETLLVPLCGGREHRMRVPRCAASSCAGVLAFVDCTSVSTTGFKWNLDAQPLSMLGLISSSNQVVDPVVTITSDQPLVFYQQLR